MNLLVPFINVLTRQTRMARSNLQSKEGAGK